MTTGNIILDRLSSTPVYYDGSTLTTASSGSYRQRQWTGGDDPTKGLTPRSFEKKFYFYPVEVSTKGGRTRQRVIRKSYRVYNRVVHRREPNAYSTTRVENQYPPGDLDQYVYELSTGNLLSQHTWSNTPLSFFISGGQPLAQTLTSNDQYRTINRLREKIVGTPFNCAVAIGEASESFTMIGDTAIKLARSAALLKRGRFREAIAATADPRAKRYAKKYASNPYLEVTYGWTPLLMDLRAGAESLAHRFSVPFVQRYRVRLKGENSLVDGVHTFRHPTSPSWDSTMYGYSTVTRQVIAEVYDEPGWIPTLGFDDPATFVWQLLPLSFVADWFYPFGDWLEARASAGLLRGRYVITDSQRVLFRGVLRQVLTDWGVNRRIENVGLDGMSQVTWTRINRFLGTELPVPMPDYKPLLEASSVRHSISGLALMMSIFGDRKLPKPLQKFIDKQKYTE
jgi:hypothetical protein